LVSSSLSLGPDVLGLLSCAPGGPSRQPRSLADQALGIGLARSLFFSRVALVFRHDLYGPSTVR
jgi:hypothetical protein